MSWRGGAGGSPAARPRPGQRTATRPSRCRSPKATTSPTRSGWSGGAHAGRARPVARLREAWRGRPRRHLGCAGRPRDGRGRGPAAAADAFSTSVFGQLLPGEADDGGTALLLSSLLRGFGKYFSRFLCVLPQASAGTAAAQRDTGRRAARGDRRRRRLQRQSPPAPGAVGAGLSDAGGGAAPGGLGVTELVVEPHPPSPTPPAVPRRDGGPVLPLDLGFQNPRMRPPLFQLLADFAPACVLLGPGVPGGGAGRRRRVRAAGAARPRIVYDGWLVLARRRWTVPQALFPSREGRVDAAHFARVDGGAAATACPAGVRQHRPTRRRRRPPRAHLHKPQYLDFANPLLVDLFGRSRGRRLGRRTLLYERLPDRRHLRAAATVARSPSWSCRSTFRADWLRPPATGVAMPEPAWSVPRLAECPPAVEDGLYGATGDRVLRDVVAPLARRVGSGGQAGSSSATRWVVVTCGSACKAIRRVLGARGGGRRGQRPGAAGRLGGYEPELERYGGGAGVVAAEDLFDASSRAALALLASCRGGPFRSARRPCRQLCGLQCSSRVRPEAAALIGNHGRLPAPHGAGDRAATQPEERFSTACERQARSLDRLVASGWEVLAEGGGLPPPLAVYRRDLGRNAGGCGSSWRSAACRLDGRPVRRWESAVAVAAQLPAHDQQPSRRDGHRGVLPRAADLRGPRARPAALRRQSEGRGGVSVGRWIEVARPSAGASPCGIVGRRDLHLDVSRPERRRRAGGRRPPATSTRGRRASPCFSASWPR